MNSKMTTDDIQGETPASPTSDAYTTADESMDDVSDNDNQDSYALQYEFSMAKRQLTDSIARLEFLQRNVQAYDDKINALKEKHEEDVRRKVLLELVDNLAKHDRRGFFLQPVTPEIAPDYRDIIKDPIDLGTMKAKVLDGDYNQMETFIADLALMFQNCKTYNQPGTFVALAGVELEKYAWELISKTPKLAHLVPEGKVIGRMPKPQKKKSPPWTFKELEVLDSTDIELDPSDRRMSTRQNP